MRTRRARPRVLSSLAVAAVAVTAVVSAPVQGVPGDPGAGARAVAAKGVDHVTLKRRQGRVDGDGRTIYTANRTEFRPRRATVDIPPVVKMRSWVVVDLDTGTILGKHDHRRRLPQASTIKLLTGMTALRTVRARPKHRVTRYEAGQICSCAGLRPGRRYTRNALLKGMLLPSGNDAAEALAGSHRRGRGAFYGAMNRLANELGATDTVVRNASGLTADGAHSSARDLVLFLRAALERPVMVKILSLRSSSMATIHGGHRRTLTRGTHYVNTYPDSLGKSGWTTPAQNTLVVVTEIDGHRIATATMGAPSDYSTSGTRALTEWAADNHAGLRAVGRLPRP